MDVRFKTPSNFYFSGQSQSRKSYLVRRMICHLDELQYSIRFQPKLYVVMENIKKNLMNF